MTWKYDPEGDQEWMAEIRRHEAWTGYALSTGCWIDELPVPPNAEVIGWIAVCSCGWHGPRHSPRPLSRPLWAPRVRSADPGPDTERELQADWHIHLADKQPEFAPWFLRRCRQIRDAQRYPAGSAPLASPSVTAQPEGQPLLRLVRSGDTGSMFTPGTAGNNH